MLLYSGFAKNRFLKVYFDGENIDYMGTETVTYASKHILYKVYTFYSENKSLIERNNALSKLQKDLIIKGVFNK